MRGSDLSDKMDWLQNQVIRCSGWSSQFCQTAETQSVLNADHATLGSLLDDSTTLLKDDRTTTVGKLELASQSFVLKRYNARSRGHRFKRALRRSRARRCWNMSYAFARAGLNVAAPVLMYEHRFGPLRLDAYFATEFLVGDELLSALPSMSVVEQAAVVAAIDVAFSKMRVAKLTHGDMKASNLLWVSGMLYFIDLDAAQQHRTEFSWRAKHAKDKKRFLKNWRSQPEILDLFAGLK